MCVLHPKENHETPSFPAEIAQRILGMLARILGTRALILWLVVIGLFTLGGWIL